MTKALLDIKHWFAEALEFTLGNPSDSRPIPPAIGPQPYRDKPIKFHD